MTGAWLSVPEVAARLGVSEKTVWRRAKAGTLPARKVAGERGGFVWEIAFDPTGQTDRPTDQTSGQKRPDKHNANPQIERVIDRTATDRTEATGQTDRLNILVRLNFCAMLWGASGKTPRFCAA